MHMKDLSSLVPPTSKSTTTKDGKKKLYKTRELTPAKKKFTEVYAETDNGTLAAQTAFPHLTKGSASVKATRLLNNDIVVNHIEYQKNKLEKLASKAVNRVEELIQSDNEMVATTNIWKTIEQVQGKAVQKSTNINYNFTQHATDKGKEYGL